MRAIVISAIFFVFQSVAASSVAQQELKIGDEITLIVQTIPNIIDGCYIKTPQNQTIEFKPENNSIENRYQLLSDNALTECQVKLTITDYDDNGLWQIYFTVNNTLVNSKHYDLIVKSSEAVTTPVSVEEITTSILTEEVPTITLPEDIPTTPQQELVPTTTPQGESLTTSIGDDEKTTWLTPVEYIVVSGMTVEISIRRMEDVFGCNLLTPNNTYVNQNEVNEGITFLQTDSDPYTSCRVQIGPLNDNSLIGNWSLCSQRLVDNVLTQECLGAYISWYNNNPKARWNNDTETKFDHPVHFGGNLNLAVQNYGTIKSCHIITPTGNNLALNEDSQYPYVTRIAPYTECSVAISPIDSQCLGEWSIYGLYTSFQGVTEVRLPTSLFLYDEQNPHEQAYNVTTPKQIVKIVNILNTIELEVTGSGDVDSCDITPPENAYIENDIVSIESDNGCKYSVGPISKDMIGEWVVTGKFSRNNLFSEIRQVFSIREEDPYNPYIEDNRVVRELEPISIETTLGSTHEVVIAGDSSFRIVESCHVRTPDGRQFMVMEGFHIPGVDVDQGTSCILKIDIQDKDMVGEWSLIARKLDFSIPVEERRSFVIHVEEPVEAIPSQLTIHENQDLVIRLRDKTEFFETCKLYSPQGEYLNFEVNPEYYEYCGFVVRDVEESMNGTWQIVYEDKIVYKASIAVNVVRRDSIDFPDLRLVMDDKVDLYTGPDDVSYCQVRDPADEVVSEGFGQCKVSISRASSRHSGKWTATVGHKGMILMETILFNVIVDVPSDYKPTVIPQVQTQMNPSTVSVSCSVETTQEVNLCKFRSPRGELMIASEGVAQGRYMAFGSGSTMTNGVYHHECGIRISDVSASDSGIWRCAIDASNDTYFGFLTVGAGGAASKELLMPQLTTLNKYVDGVVQDEITMACSIQTRIRYCYFKREDGVVINVGPGITTSQATYHGAGFEAGECGMKYVTSSARDSGNWTCHVGVDDVMEKSVAIQVTVHEELLLNQEFDEEGAMMITATAMQHIHNRQPHVDFCMFVRHDGFVVFTSHTVSPNYTALVTGNTCWLRTTRPITADLRPWTVNVKLADGLRQLTGVTTVNITYKYYGWNALWISLSLTILCLSLMILGCSLGPKKNRDWTFKRAKTISNSIRSSIRTSFRKKALALPPIIDEKPPAYTANP